MNKAEGLRSQRWQLSFKKNYTSPLKERIVERDRGGAKKVKKKKYISRIKIVDS